MSITRINQFKAVEGKERQLLDLLQSLTSYITSSKGCLSYQVLENCDDRTAFAVIEEWDSIDAHKKSVENFPKDKMLAAMPLFEGAPTGSYYQNNVQ